ncbi:MAG TPA: YggT family protein [Pyrinomonadaceae bacterium]|jgi:YggT family protein|nr:YggT family protein [Pyrinomonadaceae bacterium]
MSIFGLIGLVVWYAVVACIMTVIVLMLLRMVVNYADLNPFSRPAMTVRRFSDPLVNPVRRRLIGFGLDPKFAPLVSILIAIILGYFTLQIVGTVLFTISGLLLSLQRGAIIAVVGFLLYGLLAVYSLLIFMRIIFSWGASETNRLMLFLVRATDPILVPFRRIIPPLGMFDISPIVVLFLLRLLQEMVAATLLLR